MNAGRFAHPRMLLLTWAALLSLGALTAWGGTRWLDAHVDHLRDQSPWTYLKAAEAHAQLNNWPAALEALQAAVDRDSELAVPHERAGHILHDLGRGREALAAYRRTMARGNDSENVAGKAVWCLIQLERYNDAIALGQACLDRGMQSPYFPRFIAEAHRRAGDAAAAIPWFERALEGFPGDLLLMERLAQTYEAIGRTEDAAGLRAQIREQESAV